MNNQLELTFIGQITQAFADSNVLAFNCQSLAAQAMDKRVECGRALLQVQEQLPKSVSWGAWVEEHFKDMFSLRTAQRMVALARLHALYSKSEDAPTLSFYEWLSRRRLLPAQFQQLELLPDSHREAGSQMSHDDSDKWLSLIDKSLGELNGRIEKAPLTTWSKLDRVMLKEKLRPLYEIYQSIPV